MISTVSSNDAPNPRSTGRRLDTWSATLLRLLKRQTAAVDSRVPFALATPAQFAQLHQANCCSTSKFLFLRFRYVLPDDRARRRAFYSILLTARQRFLRRLPTNRGLSQSLEPVRA